MTQRAASEVMGLPQSSVSHLQGYKLDKFSVERLLRLATTLGQDVVIEIRPLEQKGAGRVRVVGTD
jgi:predicted XRE-type DNA-binding protein